MALGFSRVADVPSCTLLVLPRALRNPEPAVFNAIKTGSVAVAALVVQFARSQTGEEIWPTVLTVVFGVNILEAIVTDASRRAWINLTSGILLLLLIPSPSAFTLSGEPPEVLYQAGMPWILAYTIWNWAFVLNRRPHLASVHAAVLAAALLPLFFHPLSWGQNRAFTLGLHQLVSFGFWDVRTRLNVLLSHEAALGQLGAALRWISLLGVLAVCAWLIRDRKLFAFKQIV